MRGPSLLSAEDILRALARHEVDFVVIGALGAVFYGSPLRTDDLDICPSTAPENLARIAQVLSELNAVEWDPRKDDTVARVWDVDTLKVDGVWILVTDAGNFDLIFEPAGTRGFEELSRRAEVFRIEDVEIRVASLSDIIYIKETAGRPKDLEQLPTLRRLRERLEERDD